MKPLNLAIPTGTGQHFLSANLVLNSQPVQTMAIVSQKPLPDIPETAQLTNLSVEARAHLFKFVRHALSEDVHPSFSGAQQEAWAMILANACIELSDCVANEEWLLGARKSRKDAPKVSPNDTKAKEKGNVGSAKGTNARGSKVQAQVESSEAQGQEETQSRTSSRSARTGHITDNPNLALNQLRALVSQPRSSSSPSSASHLLLSVAPFGCQTPTEDSGFDIVPVNPGCTFKADVFTLPDANFEALGVHKVIICGLDEWGGWYPSALLLFHLLMLLFYR